MSQTASTLLLRNLHDVFGEIDPVRRRAAIDEIFHEDAVFYEPNGAYRGRDEIDRIAGVIKATHPDFQYQPLSPPEEIGDGCRGRWVSGSPGKPPAYAGTDFIIVRDGKIAAVYLFFDELPKLDITAATSIAPPQLCRRAPCRVRIVLWRPPNTGNTKSKERDRSLAIAEGKFAMPGAKSPDRN